MRILAPGQDDSREIAGKVSNGVKDGPHTETGNETAPPASKVVRLPRDWLGPHEEFVPFGGRVAPPDGASQLAGLPSSAEGSPPSAEDFWGERAAAIHDAVQAPAAYPAAAAVPGDHRRRRARRLGVGPPRLAAAFIAVLAIASAGAIGLLSGQPVRHAASGARLNMAAIFSDGVSRILKLGPRIASSNRAARHHVLPARHASRRAPLTKPARRPTPHPRRSPPQVLSYAARAAAVHSPNVSVASVRAESSPSPASPSRPASATVSPTGETGALGPIQSPNG